MLALVGQAPLLFIRATPQTLGALKPLGILEFSLGILDLSLEILAVAHDIMQTLADLWALLFYSISKRQQHCHALFRRINA